MSGEPKTHTLEEAIQLLGPDEVLLVGYCGWEGMQYSVVEESSVKFLTHSYGKWEDALTDRLDRKVVARDEAAELRAALRTLVADLEALMEESHLSLYDGDGALVDTSWGKVLQGGKDEYLGNWRDVKRLAGGENEK